jgi:hypothetical protein
VLPLLTHPELETTRASKSYNAKRVSIIAAPSEAVEATVGNPVKEKDSPFVGDDVRLIPDMRWHRDGIQDYRNVPLVFCNTIHRGSGPKNAQYLLRNDQASALVFAGQLRLAHSRSPTHGSRSRT